MLALLLLNMSANSRYAIGMSMRSVGSGSELEEVALSSLDQDGVLRLKVTEPSSCTALANVAGMTNSMEGAWWSDCLGGSRSGVGSLTIRTSSKGSAELGGVGLDSAGVQNDILLVAQSINRLFWASQLCPTTTMQEPSNRVTYNVVGVTAPDRKWMGRSMAWVIMLFMVLSHPAIMHSTPDPLQTPSGLSGHLCCRFRSPTPEPIPYSLLIIS